MKLVDFRDWKIRFEDFSAATRLAQECDLQARRGILRSALDQEWTKMWTQRVINVLDTDDTPEIIDKLEGYLRRHRHALVDRREFIQRVQQSGEGVDHYYAALRAIDQDCGYNHTCGEGPAHREERLRDRLISGLLDSAMRQKVLETPLVDLTLDHVLETCRNYESSRETDDQLGQGGEKKLNALGGKSSYKKNKQQHQDKPKNTTSAGGTSQNKSKTNSGNTNDKKCGRCGFNTHKNGKCPAASASCNKCGKTGHFGSVCRSATDSSKPKKVNFIALGSAMVDPMEMMTLETHPQGGVKKDFQWLPDTGAEEEAMGESHLKQLIGKTKLKLKPCSEKIIGAGKETLPSKGMLAMTIRRGHLEYKTRVHILREANAPLLSKRGCKALGILPKVWPDKKKFFNELSLEKSEKVEVQKAKPVKCPGGSSKEEIVAKFPEVFDEEGELRAMKGPEMSIELTEEAKPRRVYKAYSIPMPWKDKVKEHLDKMQEKGVIEDVPINETPEWTHPMVVVPKKNSSEPRVTVDFKAINPYVKRPGYPTKTPREEVAQIPKGMGVFTTLDARHGYWQVPLDEKSKPLTTFLTPWGPKRYCRNAMGLISAGDEHNRRGDEALQGINNVHKVVEDILIYDKEPGPVHEERVCKVIERCQEAGITLSEKKFVYAQPSVEWCGYIVSKDGYSVNPTLVGALKNFPVPVNRTDVRSFCGLVQQFEAFSTDIAEKSKPIRSLLSPKVEFVWTAHQQQAFHELIEILTSPRVLTQYKPGARLRLETDAAQTKGLGFALWQEESDKKWKLLQCGSRCITPTESRYSATEVELLAVVWAVKKCKLFLKGATFELVVDHKPLIPILNNKTLAEIETPRIINLKEKLSYCVPTAVWRQGVKHTTVDVFSRYPVTEPEKDDLEGESDIEDYARTVAINAVTQNPLVKDLNLEKVKSEGERDGEYRKLLDIVTNEEFPQHAHQLDEELRPYWKVRDALSVVEGIVMYGNRYVVPKPLRKDVLKELHAAHLGRERALQRARQNVFWPGITNDVTNMVRNCQTCEDFKASNVKEPLMQDEVPKWPGEAIAADLFSHAGKEFLVITDKFSGWPEVYDCGRVGVNTEHIKAHVLEWSSRMGLAVRATTDGGPQFRQKFAEFCKEWHIHHDPSSPEHHQSNGYAEAAVKSMKTLIKKVAPNGNIRHRNFLHALLEYRNTPRQDGLSPAQRLFGRQIRGKLPAGPAQFITPLREAIKKADRKATSLRAKAKLCYDRGAKALTPFKVGDVVRVQDRKTQRWDTIAEVVTRRPRGRSYTVKTETGRLKWRNRRFLRPYVPGTDTEPDREEEPEETREKGPRRSKRTKKQTRRFQS